MIKKLLWGALAVLAVLGLWKAWEVRMGQPEDFARMEDQFKYGSIGGDHPLAAAPLPYWLWKVLPELFPPATTIPNNLGPRNGLKGLDAFGLVTEANPTPPIGYEKGPRFDRPIGFSRRRTFGVDLVGMNCSFCHLGSVRASPGAAPQLVLGGVGNTIDIEQYFLYVFNALRSPDFTAERVMPAIERELKRQGAELPWWQRLAYRWLVIPIVPRYVGMLQDEWFDFLMPKGATRQLEFGPGRVDTWALYKRIYIENYQREPAVGTVDFPPIWNQKAREGMRLHWDGNSDLLVERNIISGLGLIGPHVSVLDFPRLSRVTEWIVGLLPPRFEDSMPDGALGPGRPAVDMALVAKGRDLFRDHCAQCHAPGADRVGRVEPIADLGTDTERITAFTPQLADTLNQLGTQQWQLRNFRVQNGYVNNLLDGIWLRAPYLHNGSVPTLRDLLTEPAKRPQRFCRGGDVYDWKNLGFVSALAPASNDCPTSYLFDTKLKGHSNAGHGWGSSLPEADKDALIEFMKTL